MPACVQHAVGSCVSKIKFYDKRDEDISLYEDNCIAINDLTVNLTLCLTAEVTEPFCVAAVMKEGHGVVPLTQVCSHEDITWNY